MSGYGAVIPYSQPFGVGYQAPLSYVGYAEQIVFNVNSSIFLFLPIAAIIAAIGIVMPSPLRRRWHLQSK